MLTFFDDFRYSLRALLKNPTFLFTALISMSIATGANTAVYSIIQGILLHPLPYPGSDRIVSLYSTLRLGRGGISPAEFRDIQQQAASFQQLAIGRIEQYTLTNLEHPEAIWGGGVSPEMFHVLGIKPMLGRIFSDDERESGNTHVVILSEGLWSRAYNRDPEIVGKTVLLNHEPYTVIGIFSNRMLPFDAALEPRADLWVPITYLSYERQERVARTFFVIGRLKSGVSLASAQNELLTIGRRLELAYPATNTSVNFSAEPLAEVLVSNVRALYLVVLGIVGVILLIACVNLTNLGLVRAFVRSKDTAVRIAMGASRAALLRLYLMESLVLSLLCCVTGFLAGLFSLRLFAFVLHGNLPAFASLEMNRRVLIFTIAISVVCTLISSILPILFTLPTDLNSFLKSASRGTTASLQRRWLQSALVVSEMMFACLLSVGTGLMVNTMIRLYHVDPGFDPRNLIAVEIEAPEAKYPQGRPVAAYFQRITEKLESLPGILGVSAVTAPPISGRDTDRNFVIEGAPPPAPRDVPNAQFRVIGPGYFHLMKVPILAGREFTDADIAGTPYVVIINEAFKKRYFPSGDPIGKEFRRGLSGSTMPLMRIVGIVGNMRHAGLDSNYKPEFFIPYLQDGRNDMYLVLRTGPSPTSVFPAIRNAISAIDSEQPIFSMLSMSQMIDGSLSNRRIVTELLGFFAGLALVLAAVGVYSVTSSFVSDRTQEFGVRLALGAKPSNLVALVMRRGMWLTCAGIVAGLILVIPLSRVLRALLFGVGTLDAPTYCIVIVILAVGGLLANYAPAVRASRTQPMTALRNE